MLVKDFSLQSVSSEDIADLVDMETDDDTSPYIFADPEPVHQANLADASMKYLKIMHASELAGFVILKLDDDNVSVEFRRIVVSKKGRGIGQSAIAAMEDFCRRSFSRSRIWLDVLQDNRRARHIYEKLGYTMFGESEAAGKSLVLYEKEIQAS